jgi:hypothetical protein
MTAAPSGFRLPVPPYDRTEDSYAALPSPERRIQSFGIEAKIPASKTGLRDIGSRHEDIVTIRPRPDESLQTALESCLEIDCIFW